MDKPIYRHDCPKCIFIQNYQTKGSDLIPDGVHDVYFCEQAGIPTLIVRWSSSGSDYFSGIKFFLDALFKENKNES